MGQWRLALGLALALAGCQGKDEFRCRSDDECTSGGAAGRCEMTGYCSFPDEACASGHRYGDLADEGFAGLCVPPGDTAGSTTADTAGSSGDAEPAVCGDGEATADEVCDGADLAGATCLDLGFAGGNLQCTPTCELDDANCNLCGNAVIDAGEECDGTTLGAFSSCADVGLGEESEALVCTSDCQLSYAACSACGDGMITAPEQCDHNGGVGDATCMDAGFDGGLLGCTAGCVFDTSGCASCGNAEREVDEDCDGADLGGQDCAGIGFEDGNLQCANDCSFDTSNCSACGDGVVSGSEACDPSVPSSLECSTYGFDSGTATCEACVLNDSGCGLCGNGDRDGAEACDQLDLGGATCATQGFFDGNLACNADCSFDVSACNGEGCGDGAVNAGEDCDGEALGGGTCASEGFDGGPLDCSPSCEYVTNGCYSCGDGDLNPGENCDGNAFGGASCTTLGFDGGSLSCTGACEFNTSACYACGDGFLDPGEQCDTNAFGGETCMSQGFDGGALGCTADCTLNTAGCGDSIDIWVHAGGNSASPGRSPPVASTDRTAALWTPAAQVRAGRTSWLDARSTVSRVQASRSGAPRSPARTSGWTSFAASRATPRTKTAPGWPSTAATRSRSPAPRWTSAAATPTDAMGTPQKIGRYEVIRALGAGGMGEVYLGRARLAGDVEKRVAIKRILPSLACDKDFVDMFLQEAKLAALLEHPNIVHVSEVGRDRETYFLVMTYLDGGSLDRVLRWARDGARRIPIRFILELGLGMLAGLSYAHEKLGYDGTPLQIVHRDVTPQNVYVTYAGEVKILDFGIAKATQSRVITAVGTRKGKAGYMSPEQCLGLAVDARSDVFSVGVLMYELLTLQRPFGDRDTVLEGHGVGDGAFTPASQFRPDVIDGLDGILAKALARDVSDRYPSAKAFRRALAELVDTTTLRTGPDTIANLVEKVFGPRQGSVTTDVDLLPPLPEFDTTPPPHAPEDPQARRTTREFPTDLATVDEEGPTRVSRTRTPRAARTEVAPPRATKAAPAPEHRVTQVANPPDTLTRPKRHWLVPASWALVAVALLVAGSFYAFRADPTAEPAAPATTPTPPVDPAPAEDWGGVETSKLANLVAESDPKRALDYASRHRILAELQRRSDVGDLVDARTQTALDLRQAATAPAPCKAMESALDMVENDPHRRYLTPLVQASEDAQSQPLLECKGVAERIDRLASTVAKKVKP